MSVRFNVSGLRYFLIGSIALHALVFTLGRQWLWQPPVYDINPESPPITIQLEEWIEPVKEPEPPPPEPAPEPEPEPEPIPELEPPPEPEMEPEPVPPEPEIIPEPPAPEPIEQPEPEPVPEPEPPPAATRIDMEQPTYLRNPTPPYPLVARKNGWSGTVMLRVEVTANGRAANVTIARSCGHDILDEAARSTIMKWRFRPARIAGQPTATTVKIPVTFNLENQR